MVEVLEMVNRREGGAKCGTRMRKGLPAMGDETGIKSYIIGKCGKGSITEKRKGSYTLGGRPISNDFGVALGSPKMRCA